MWTVAAAKVDLSTTAAAECLTQPACRSPSSLPSHLCSFRISKTAETCIESAFADAYSAVGDLEAFVQAGRVDAITPDSVRRDLWKAA